VAIKGKGKTRSKSAARAPRRAPVEVKPAFARRRWVQVLAALLAGALVVLSVLWVMNGLRRNREESENAADASARRAVLQQWQTTLEGVLGTIGDVNAGQPPTILPDLEATIDAMAEGKGPDDSQALLKQAAEQADAAVEQLKAVDLSSQIADSEAFTADQTIQLLNSRDEYVLALTLYGDVARLGLVALNGDQEQELAKRARRQVATAKLTANDAYENTRQVLATAGLVNLAPTSPFGLGS
jgi:hypothetical protein